MEEKIIVTYEKDGDIKIETFSMDIFRNIAQKHIGNILSITFPKGQHTEQYTGGQQ